jgi:hypothetical protein
VVAARSGEDGGLLSAEVEDVEFRAWNWRGRNYGSIIVRTIGLPPIRENHLHCHYVLVAVQVSAASGRKDPAPAREALFVVQSP